MVAGSVVLTSCKKNLVSDTILPVTGLPANNSSIRLFNLFGFPMDVTVNNIPLTAYSQSGTTGVGQGVALFPGGVWNDGTSFTIPYTLINKDGTAKISILPRVYNKSGASPLPAPADTVLADDPLHPTDYYLLSDGHLHPIARSAAVPSQPFDFKIRVINLSSITDTNNLAGPMTLTYADGSLVDPKLTNVQQGSISDYVELPYAAIEFKLFANQNFTQQLSRLPVEPNFQPGSGGGGVFDQEARFSPTQTFKPGGVYAVVISQNIIQYFDRFGTVYYVPANSYRIITENSPAVNITYARIQAVNVYPSAGKIDVQVDGRSLGTRGSFGENTDYSIFVQGNHQVQAFDQNGNLLVQQNMLLFPYDNITAWVYENDSVPALCFSANDMNSVHINMQFNFLNLCSGLPFLTFAADNYGPLGANLLLGEPVTENPYLAYDLTPGPLNPNQPDLFDILRAYASSPGPPVKVPGAYLDHITPIYSRDFVANPAMYSQPALNGEPGDYTVALIGKMGVAVTDSNAARILILKHSK